MISKTEFQETMRLMAEDVSDDLRKKGIDIAPETVHLVLQTAEKRGWYPAF